MDLHPCNFFYLQSQFVREMEKYAEPLVQVKFITQMGFTIGKNPFIKNSIDD